MKNKRILVGMSEHEKNIITEFSHNKSISASKLIRDIVVEKIEQNYVPFIDFEYTGEFDSLIIVMVNETTRNKIKTFCEEHYGKQRYMSVYIRTVVLEEIENKKSSPIYP